MWAETWSDGTFAIEVRNGPFQSLPAPSRPRASALGSTSVETGMSRRRARWIRRTPPCPERSTYASSAPRMSFRSTLRLYARLGAQTLGRRVLSTCGNSVMGPRADRPDRMDSRDSSNGKTIQVLVGRAGNDPATNGLKVRCSTN
jgi:hypothetical protein